jgi:hypothetical protein
MPDDRTSGRVGDRYCVGEDPLHPLIRSEGAALLDTDGGEQAPRLDVEHLLGFALDELGKWDAPPPEHAGC